MSAESFVRRILSPLRDAAAIDRALADVPELSRGTRAEAFERVVRARGRATDARVALVDALRERAAEFLTLDAAGTTTRGDGRESGRAVRAVTRASTSLAAAVGATMEGGSLDGRTERGKYAVAGTYKGTSTRDEDLKVRFWNLWGGSKKCRDVMTKSARGSVYRDPARLERAVLALDRVVPFVDAPLLLHRAPELLEMDTEELVRRLVKMKWLFPKRDVGFLATQTPELLMLEPERLASAVSLFEANGGESVSEFVQVEGVEALEALADGDRAVDVVVQELTIA